MKPLRVLSLGAGVQSSALALMMQKGEIEPADVMVFADTCAEPEYVYRWLGMIASWCTKIPLLKVQHNEGPTKAIERGLDGHWFPPPPLFTVNEDGSKGMLRRMCTDRFKIRPIQTRVRKLLAKGQTCVMVRGISKDEEKRATPSKIGWAVNEHPLVDMEMTRQTCQRWLVTNGYPTAPRSACTYCPYRCNAEWQKMRDLDPGSWAEAVRVDALVRNMPNFKSKLFVHSQRVPLAVAKIDDDTMNHNDGSMGWTTCPDGICGV